jgi:hypothetical protein
MHMLILSRVCAPKSPASKSGRHRTAGRGLMKSAPTIWVEICLSSFTFPRSALLITLNTQSLKLFSKLRQEGGG